jgi:hypothetical protein
LVGKPTTPYNFGILVKQIFSKQVALIPSNINGKGTKNLVLNTNETEKLLGISMPEHETELRKFKELTI